MNSYRTLQTSFNEYHKVIVFSFAILFIFSFTSAQAQMVYMPDQNLRVKLTNLGYGSCIVGDSIDSSCPLVVNATSLDITYGHIFNLQGIDAFVNLIDLYCGHNQLQTFSTLPNNLNRLICHYNNSGFLTISGLPTNLRYLDCSWGLSNVNIIDLPSSLETLISSYNSNLSLPTLPFYLKYLDVRGNYASVNNCSICYLPALPQYLEHLYCSNNHLVNFSLLPGTLITLDCKNNLMTALPPLPSSLITLDCGNNQLTALPQLPNSLYRLYCNNNLITNLPVLSDSLRYLNCSNNQLDTLPSIPLNLNDVYCNNNQITSLPDSLANIINLNCSNNLLSSLSSLPPSLRFLNCSNNIISSFPSLPSGINYLDLFNNQVSSMPTLTGSLTYLDCSINNLSSLPTLPNSLLTLGCESNFLATLPALNGNLNYLDCSNNPITSLPTLPSNLRTLKCGNTLISSLPSLTDTMTWLYVSDNPNLNCLPYLTTLQTLNFDNCPVTCLPNYSQISSCSPALTNYPLCDIFNPNGCNFYWNISGKIFFDIDSNCIQGTNESGVRNIRVNLFDNGGLIQQAFTGGEGLYSFDVNNYGNYGVSLDTSQIPFIPICPSTSNYLDTIDVIDSLVYGNDFSLKCKNDPDMGVWSIFAARMTPGHRPIVKIHAGEISNQFGLNCSNGVSGTLTVTIDGSAHYMTTSAGSLTPSFISSDSINYVIPDFGNINSSSDFGIELFVDTTAIAGSSICINVSLIPDLGDYDSTNNSLTNCFNVVSSFDPNDKEVYPKGIIDTTNKWLTYSIRFQNTGTAPADNIYILDTLDSNLDISSFQLLSTSHSAYIQILSGGIAKFNFPNINLPDSNTNELLSHGYVQYRLKMKDNLSNGANVNNTAYIFFDYNPAVVTNTVTNTINVVNNTTTALNNTSINIWPVPFENYFYMETNKEFQNSNYSIFNLVGIETCSDKIVSQIQKINSKNWSSGIYFLTIKNSFGTIVKKLIKN